MHRSAFSLDDSGMDAAKTAGMVLGGALLVIVVLALLEVARRKQWPDLPAKIANVIAPLPA